MKSSPITFQNSNGYSLSASFEEPDEPKENQKIAVFAHCFTCNKNFKAVQNIIHGLSNHGFRVLRFDFTGLGQSEGEFSQTNFTSNVEDLIDASNYIRDRFGEDPKLLIGHSLGGDAAIFAASQLPYIQAVATIGSPSTPQNVTHHFHENLQEIEQNGKATVNIGGRPFTISNQFIKDISEQNMQRVLQELDKPYLILHSPDDEVVEITHASVLFKMARHPRSFISLAGADHLLSNEQDSIYTGEVIGQWAERYID